MFSVSVKLNPMKPINFGVWQGTGYMHFVNCFKNLHVYMFTFSILYTAGAIESFGVIGRGLRRK